MEPVTLASFTLASTILCSSVVILLSYLVYQYVLEPFKFREKLGMPQAKVQYPLIGNLLLEFTKPPPDIVLESYNEFPNERFFGTYDLQTPKLVVRDPELVEAVLIRDFAQLSDRGTGDDPNKEKAKHLLNLNGEQWKHMRNKLSPTFTSGKLRGMHSQLIDCGEILAKYMEKLEDGRPFEIRDVISRFTMDVITSCAFGLSIDTINEPNSPFRRIGLGIFKPSWSMKIIVTLRGLLTGWIMNVLRGKITLPWQNRKKTDDFFKTTLDETIEYRQKNSVSRPDFLQLTNQIRIADQEAISRGELDPSSPYVFDHNALVSNAFVFFLAGFETTASTISYTMYEFALNDDVQDKAYQEVSRVLNKHGGSATYEATQEMHYLEQCISETLRKYPPVPMVARKSNGEYRIPGSDLVLPDGTKIAVPIYALHHDPQYYPEPEKYLPDRFDAEKDLVRKGTYQPFGGGPRICIGARFAKLEAKVCLSMLLSKYKFIKCEKTHVPIKFDRRAFMLAPEGGVWIALQRRRES